MPTLLDQYQTLTNKLTFKQTSPFIIRLFENPASPMPFPGKLGLREHDYMHCILGQGLGLKGEAYTLGFTFGCDDQSGWFSLLVYKFVATFLYPKQYAFKAKHWQIFDEAFELGKRSRMRNLHRVDFKAYETMDVAELHDAFVPV